MEIQVLKESNELLGQPEALRKRLRFDGYLFFRSLLLREKVLAVRKLVLEACQAAGWLRKGTVLDEALTDHPAVEEGVGDWVPVYERIQKQEAFHRLPHEPAVVKLMESLFEESVVCLPNKICRIAFPNNNAKATPAHQDFLYIQGSTETLTCWAPLGDVSAALGGLMVQPASHKAGFFLPHKHPGVGGNAVDFDPTLPWAGTDFKAGDVLVFHSMLVHAARPSTSPDRLRLSTDFRFCGLSHAVADSNIGPHWSWIEGSPFNWDNLDKGWDPSFRRYWERLPLKLVKLEPKLYAAD
jgi:hypothetical protein